MEVIAFLVPFLLLGGLVLYIAFWGGPSGARHASMTGGQRIFSLTMVALYIGLGIAVPGLVIANKGEAAGGVGALRSADMTSTEVQGKELFMNYCASCHSLAAVNAYGITGPSLDQIGDITPERVVNAIRNGGTGQGLMPAGLLDGEEAEAVAEYVSRVAGAN